MCDSRVKTGTKNCRVPRNPTSKCRDTATVALRRRPTREEIFDSPLLFDEKRFQPWARRRYGKPFMDWVQKNWITASEREIQVMHRAWVAAGGAPGRRRGH